jgi:hypothetical protein
MEMDLGTAIVGLMSILICISPFVIIYYIKVKKENKWMQSLNEMAQQHHCNVGQHEFCSDFVMGIDENRNFVFFFKQNKEETLSQFVDLSEIQSCQAVKKSRNVHNGKDSHSLIDSLELHFTPTNKNTEEISFKLYDAEINIQLSGELQFADKWVKLINDRLKNKKF